jgi:hypothetical protein
MSHVELDARTGGKFPALMRKVISIQLTIGVGGQKLESIIL